MGLGEFGEKVGGGPSATLKKEHRRKGKFVPHREKFHGAGGNALYRKTKGNHVKKREGLQKKRAFLSRKVGDIQTSTSGAAGGGEKNRSAEGKRGKKGKFQLVPN